MNLQPVSMADISLGKPLPWRLYDRDGYVAFARGALVESREQLQGLMRDMDAPAQGGEADDLGELGAAPAVDSFPPAGIKPQPGERVQLRLLNRDLQVYYASRLIGYVKGRSVLLTTPLVSGVPLILADGERLEVRMVTGNNIYTFRAAIQRLCVSPLHYLHLEYPAEVRVQQLRKSPWARTGLSASATGTGGEKFVVRLANLSADGALLHGAAVPGKPGDTLKLTFEAVVDEQATRLELAATIRHVNPLPQSGQAGMVEAGVEFDHVTAEQALWLRALVYRHIAEGGLA